MKNWFWYGLIACLCAFALVGYVILTQPPNYDQRCDFCSGSGVGADCPRYDRQAKRECMGSLQEHYCGTRPRECG